MQRKNLERWIQKRNDSSRIGPLDGIRAVAIMTVVWFHFWQQSWLMPITRHINLDWLPRNGCIAVDLMVLLSGFCLFLPYAKQMTDGGEPIPAKIFYKKRMIRIMPSYYVSILIILLCFALPSGEYQGSSELLKDLGTHILFIHNWFKMPLLSTRLNSVLWTVGVLVQFYLIFPLLAKAFQKKPLLTYICMTLVGLLSGYFIHENFTDGNAGLYVNHTFTFFSVYANGMMGACAYVHMTKEHEPGRVEGIFYSLASIACIWVYKIMCDHRQSYEGEQLWQVDYRYILSLVFMVFVVSTSLSTGWYRKIWDNVIMRFISLISFNLYICHQYIAVKLKEYHIPEWSGGADGWQSDKTWQWKYTFLCIFVSLVVATAMTFVVERPMARLLSRKKTENK